MSRSAIAASTNAYRRVGSFVLSLLSLLVITLWGLLFLECVHSLLTGQLFIHPNNGCKFVNSWEAYAFALWPSLAGAIVWILLIVRPTTRAMSLTVALLSVLLLPHNPYLWCDALYWFWRWQ